MDFFESLIVNETIGVLVYIFVEIVSSESNTIKGFLVFPKKEEVIANFVANGAATLHSRGRRFALGALKAAKWIDGKKGFFSIDDMMKEIIK